MPCQSSTPRPRSGHGANQNLIDKIARIEALRADNAADPHPSFEALARADLARRR